MVLEKKDGDERERRFLFLCQKLSRSVEKGGVNFLFSSFSLFFFSSLSLLSFFLRLRRQIRGRITQSAGGQVRLGEGSTQLVGLFEGWFEGFGDQKCVGGGGRERENEGREIKSFPTEQRLMEKETPPDALRKASSRKGKERREDKKKGNGCASSRRARPFLLVLPSRKN